jgi:hypothetical protein
VSSPSPPGQSGRHRELTLGCSERRGTWERHGRSPLRREQATRLTVHRPTSRVRHGECDCCVPVPDVVLARDCRPGRRHMHARRSCAATHAAGPLTVEDAFASVRCSAHD